MRRDGPVDAVHNDDGHLVDVTLHGEDARSRGRALDALDGHAWRGAQITALEGREADQKREAKDRAVGLAGRAEEALRLERLATRAHLQPRGAVQEPVALRESGAVRGAVRAPR